MTTRIKIYLALAVAAFLIIASYSLWADFRLGKLEDAAGAAKQRAETEAQRANELEKSARKYEEKIAYLESNLAELKALAKKQDEELKIIEITTGRARADVERARSIRTAAATAGEVCRKLADLGYPCE
jgi:chromosome segregation ATPase